jgi:hypothetical protein
MVWFSSDQIDVAIRELCPDFGDGINGRAATGLWDDGKSTEALGNLVGRLLQFWVTESHGGCVAMTRFRQRHQPASESKWDWKAAEAAESQQSIMVVDGGNTRCGACEKACARWRAQFISEQATAKYIWVAGWGSVQYSLLKRFFCSLEEIFGS